jgi:NADH:ubiquinone reductase (H+-translocating)
MASPAGAWLGVPTDRAGRVAVGPDLSVPGHPEILVLGDTALATSDGRPVPGVAPAAKQQGEHAARVVRARLTGREAPAFRYRSAGQLATVGRRRAVAEFGRVRVSGLPAWLLWSVAHVWFLIGFRNRAVVAASWAWTYLTAQRGTRLITGLTGSRLPGMADPEPFPAIANERRTAR